MELILLPMKLNPSKQANIRIPRLQRVKKQTPEAMFQSPQFTPPSRFLQVKFEGHIHRRLTVVDSNTSTPICIADSNGSILFCTKPLVLSFYRPSTPSSAVQTQIGSASSHWLTRTIDLQLGSSTVPLKPKGKITRSAEFQSSIGPLTWQHDRSHDDLQLVHPNGDWLARFKDSGSYWTKTVVLEISGAVQWGPGLLDEIMISGIAKLMAERIQNASTAGAGA
ncbi:hypothetical protein MMC29_003546 [Sticta canariensis]|nr:hypothetical protein [Sticta canariensis]